MLLVVTSILGPILAERFAKQLLPIDWLVPRMYGLPQLPTKPTALSSGDDGIQRDALATGRLIVTRAKNFSGRGRCPLQHPNENEAVDEVEMQGWSARGCGVMCLGLKRDFDGRLETTRWVTLLFMPVMPLSRWRVRCLGEAHPYGPEFDPSLLFDPVERLPIDVFGACWTALCGWSLGIVALAPACVCIDGVQGRAATPFELVLIFASCAWPLAVLFWVWRRWKAVVQQMTEQ